VPPVQIVLARLANVFLLIYIGAPYVTKTNVHAARHATLLYLLLIVLFSSCAATYKGIKPAAIRYPAIDEAATFSYKYNVVKEARNKKLAKKEEKKQIRIVAIQIYNNTGRTLRYGQNYRFYAAGSVVPLIDPLTAAAALKQTVPTYLLYLLLTPMRLTVTAGNKSSSTPIGYVIGPALALGNGAVAASANKRFKQELVNNSPLNRDIKAGETFYGLIAIRDNGFMPLTLKVIR
jgi:hypothetical protein